MPYLATLAEVKTFTVMTAEDVDDLERREPGWILTFARALQAKDIDARLRKRYAPDSQASEEVFSEPYPFAVRAWLGQLLTPWLFRKRGVNPSDEQQEQISKDRDAALAELKEAADSVVGLYDLPLRANTSDPGNTQSFPLVSSSQNPWSWTDDQRRAIR
jgi:hypothetical protein